MGDLSRAVVSWAVLISVAAVYGAWACRFPLLDLRRSTHDCTLLRHCTPVDMPACCAPLGSLCLSPAVALTLSPRWLANVAGMGGPLLTWLPLLCFSRGGWPTLRLALLWYLALIGIVRHTHRVLDGWDPSGHVFVYGAQLLPLWIFLPMRPLSAREFLPQPVALSLHLWSYVLIYLSCSTAAFYHTASETAAGFALVALLWLFLSSSCGGSGLSTEHCYLLSAEYTSSGEVLGARATVHVALIVVVASMWLGPTVAAWRDARPADTALLAGFIAYDGALWILFSTMELCPALSNRLCQRAAPARRDEGTALRDQGGSFMDTPYCSGGS